MKTVIQITRENHELCRGYIKIHLIFGDVNIPNAEVEVMTDRIIKVSTKHFHDAGFNPCQIVNGFLGEVRA